MPWTSVPVEVEQVTVSLYDSVTINISLPSTLIGLIIIIVILDGTHTPSLRVPADHEATPCLPLQLNSPSVMLILSLLCFPVTRLFLCQAVAMVSLLSFQFHLLLHNVGHCKCWSYCSTCSKHVCLFLHIWLHPPLDYLKNFWPTTFPHLSCALVYPFWCPYQSTHFGLGAMASHMRNREDRGGGVGPSKRCDCASPVSV